MNNDNLNSENKEQIARKLGELLKLTRAGADVDRIEYSQDANLEEICTIYYQNGYQKNVCVTADSGKALIKDVLETI